MITLVPSYPAPAVFNNNLSPRWMSAVLSNRIAYHVVFWFFIFGFNAAYIAFIGEDRDVSLFNLGLRIPFILLCCYVNLYWLMPQFYYSGRLALYGALALVCIFAINAINLYLLELFVDTPVCPTTFEADATFNSSNYVYKGFYLFCIVGLTSGIKLSKNHLAERQRTEAIEKERLQTELSLLKSQINPHFFFNTLNNLYALTIKRSDEAPEMVLKLSDLMSYSLYESEGSQVSLEKEIKHIRNYIELETVRLGKMKVDFTVNGATEHHNVSPLLLLPMIENCFKHAVAGPQGQASVITIDLTVASGVITLQTRNAASADSRPLNKKGGIGLRNLQRRLQLLFGNRYRFEAHTEADVYTALLQIPVA